MKMKRIVVLTAAVLVSQLALAKLPMTNDVFGKSEGTLDFCAQANPRDAAKYQERKKSLIRGASEKEVADARQTQEYKTAYDWITDELGKVPKDQTAAACNAVLQSDK
jgi:hypothetical protein